MSNEEERRKKRALHVRIAGLKESGEIEEEVNDLLKRMGINEQTHIGA